MSKALVKSTPGVSLSTVDDMWRFARIAAMSGHLRTDKNADAAISDAVMRIQAGAELGIGPHAAMAGILFIKGQQTFKANLVAALVKDSERYDYKIVDHDNNRCRIEWFEDGESVGFSEFTDEDRERAGLKKKGPKGDTNWGKYPRNMMFARALTQGARWYCPDIFTGGVYTAEEIQATVVEGNEPQTELAKKDEPEDAEFEEPAPEVPEDENGERPEPKKKATAAQGRSMATKLLAQACGERAAQAREDLLREIPEGLPKKEHEVFKLARNAIGLMHAGELPTAFYESIPYEAKRDKTLRVWAQAREWVPALDAFEAQIADAIQDAEDKRLEDEGKQMSQGAA